MALTFLRRNSFSRLTHNAKNALRLARFIPNRRIGDVEVDVLW
jgi:hypothetical protein